MSRNFYNESEDTAKNCEVQCSPHLPSKVCKCEDSYVVGNSVNFTVDNCDSEIKADVTVSYRDTVRIWGQVKDCNGKPVPYAYLKLIKYTGNGYQGVAHTIADCLGFYQFDICPHTDGKSFRLLVGKASVGGRERTVSTGLEGTNCNPCHAPGLRQCDGRE